jgi:hypothetical protein
VALPIEDSEDVRLITTLLSRGAREPTTVVAFAY